MLIYICSKIMNISVTVQSFRTDTIFIINILKENNSEKNGGILVLVLCPMKFYICSTIHENNDDRFKLYSGYQLFF